MASADRLIEVFDEAKALPAGAERERFLTDRCKDDAALKEQVVSLLEANDGAGDFLRTSPVAPRAGVTEQIGDRIGRYKLLQVIGEGGMGTVFMAEQTEPIQRKVALKVIKAGMDSGQVIARFEAERQALAMMDHLNIARVLDAGATESGRPYFVMELVHGVPITRYCDDNLLTPRERLELFVPVCHAIQHAHQKGIIHRDIKPSNVMITLYDGKPVPKVIDFGVAKATEQKLTGRTLFTQYGGMVGTLEYMSPEQAEMSALGVDTRSDIYSLGVLLYELLTGSTPLSHKRLKEAAYGEVLRMIKEEEPPSPSTRLSNSGEALASISLQRHMEPARLTKLVRGELDWIVMKTLEKDRNRRYETASGFAADVERYLNDETVQACPPSALYRFRKFARRHHRALASAGLLGVMLLLGVVLLLVSNVQIKQEQKRTEAQKTRAETALGAARENLNLAEENLGLALEALDNVYMKEIEKRVLEKRQLSPADRDFLQKGLRFYEQFGKRNSSHIALQGATARANRRAGYLRLELGQWQEAGVHFRKAIPLLEKLAAESPTAAEPRRELASTRHGLSVGLRHLGPLNDAEATCRQAIASWKQLATDFPTERDHRVQLGHSLWQLREILSITGSHQEAEKAVREALKVYEELSVEFPDALFYRQERALSCWHLADSLKAQGRLPEAVENFQQAALLYAGLVAASPDNLDFVRQELAYVHSGLGHALEDSRRAQEAEDAYRQAVGLHEKLVEEAPRVVVQRMRLAWANTDLARLLLETKRFPEAELYSRRALDLCKDLVAEDRAEPDYWSGMARQSYALAQVIQAAGRPDEVQQACEQAVEAYREALPLYQRRAADSPTSENRWHVADCQACLGEALRMIGQPEQTIKVWRESTLIVEGLFNELKLLDHGRVLANRRGHLGNLLKEIGKLEEAEAAYRDSLAVWTKLVADYNRPEDRSSLAMIQAQLADMDNPESHNHIAWQIVSSPASRPPAIKLAVGLAQKAVARAPGAGHFWNTLGIAQYRDGNWKEAATALLRSDDLYQGGANFGFNGFFLAMAIWQQGDQEKARDWYTAALAWMERYGPNSEELRRFRAEAAALLRLPGKPPQTWIPSGDMEIYTLVLKANPEAAWAHFARGRLHGAAKQSEEAEADFRRALDLYTKAAELKPTDASRWDMLGIAHADLGAWDRAEADFARANELKGGDPLTTYRLALMRLQRGEHAGYRKICSEMIERFGTSAAPGAIFWTVWTCVLEADAVADWPRVVALAEEDLAPEPKSLEPLDHLGAALYRAGRFQESADRLSEAEAAFTEARQPANSLVYNWLFQAMTQHRLGHAPEAKAWLEKAAREIDQSAAEASIAWNRRLTWEILRREAEQVLRTNPGARPEEE